MKNIDKTCFCPHTLGFFFRLTERDKKFHIYPLRSVYFRTKKTLLTCCGDCHNLVVKNFSSQVSCFQRYYLEIKSYLNLEEAHQ